MKKAFILFLLLILSFQPSIAKELDTSQIENFRSNSSLIIEKILHSNMPTINKTYENMLKNFDNQTTHIYNQFLKDKNNYTKNQQYINKIQSFLDEIALYPNTIHKQFEPLIKKYDLYIDPDYEFDYYINKFYFEKYNVKGYKKYMELTSKTIPYYSDKILIKMNRIKNYNKNRRYLVYNYEYYYDIATLSKINDTVSIDVIYNIDPSRTQPRLKSPFDKNYIQYLIFNTSYSTKTQTMKVKYQGFITGNWQVKNDGILFKNAKIYYNNNFNLIPYIDKYIEDFKNCAKLVGYDNDIKKIINAVKTGDIYKFDNLYSSINRYNDI